MDTSTLSMTAIHASPAGLVEVIVPGDQGIYLPAAGVRCLLITVQGTLYCSILPIFNFFFF